MRGSVRWRNGAWGFRVDLPDAARSGRRRQFARQGFATEEEAQDALAVLVRSERPVGVSHAGSEVSVGEWVERWLRDQSVRVSAGTLRTYRISCRRITERLGDRLLDRLTAREVTEFSAGLMDGGATSSGSLSSSTARNTHMVLHKVLADAVKLELIPWNPADGATPPKVENAAYRVWTAEQVVAFFESVREHRMYPLFVLLATTGMRRGEALGLRWRWVDLDDRSLSIVTSLGSVDGVLVESVPKTRSGRRRLDLDDDTAAVLKALRDERIAIEGGIDPDSFVFADVHGAPLRPATVSAAFDRLVAAAGLPRIRLHDLRHTYATLAVEAGMHPEILTERLGHSSVATTLDMYAHVSTFAARGSADVVAGQFFRSRP